MKRYILNDRLDNMRRVDADVIVVGSGAAGLYAAINIAPELKCIVLNKSGIEHANSMYAQGGVAAVTYPNSNNDNRELHYSDTIEAGAGLCDQKAVRVLVNEAWDNIEQLISIGVPFDTRDGKLLLTREGGHIKNRILHSGGDATGLHLTKRLYDVAAGFPNIQIKHNSFLSDIITCDSGAAGVIALENNDVPVYYASSKVIIASGGIGRIYRNSTNAECATGDGIAAAERAGALLSDMEFVQFHPTALIHPDENGRYFLISEALRGEGAILRNRRWEPFMQGVHPLADLAPRDIVSRAILTEMKKNNIPHVYLDITNRSRNFLKKRFPTIYNECMKRDIDIAADWIPVIPVQHYFMGGIKTDIDGRTNIDGLYACGESACTGVHGANRLASNSLLECLVFGRRCARHINGSKIMPPPQVLFDGNPDNNPASVPDFDSLSSEIRTLTTQKCGIIRCAKELKEAEVRIREILEQIDAADFRTPKSIETYNRAQVALAVIQAGLRREKSVGAHFISNDEVTGGK